METTLTDDELALVVLKKFIRVIKNRNLYSLFRCTLGYDGRKSVDYRKFIYGGKKSVDYGTFNHSFSTIKSPFGAAYNCDEIVTAMRVLIKENGMQLANKQMIISNHINNLLHFCVEPYESSFEKLNEIGKEIFDITCKKIFGEDFVDETEQEPPSEMPPLKLLRRYLEDASSVINANSFEDFINKRRGILSAYNSSLIDPQNWTVSLNDSLYDELF